MTWLQLESKMFASAAYDPDKQILYLRFRKTGDVHRYFEFPATDYQIFLDAESNGRFFLAHIREASPSSVCPNSTPLSLSTRPSPDAHGFTQHPQHRVAERVALAPAK